MQKKKKKKSMQELSMIMGNVQSLIIFLNGNILGIHYLKWTLNTANRLQKG